MRLICSGISEWVAGHGRGDGADLHVELSAARSTQQGGICAEFGRSTDLFGGIGGAVRIWRSIGRCDVATLCHTGRGGRCDRSMAVGPDRNPVVAQDFCRVAFVFRAEIDGGDTVTVDVLVSLLIGVLAGLGVGSGGLLIVYLTWADGMDQLAAQGMNLALFVFALGSAVLVHLHRRRLSVPLLGFVVLFGGVGALAGSLLAQEIHTGILRNGLGYLLLLMGAVSLFKKE